MSLHDVMDVFDAGHDHEQVVFANDPPPASARSSRSTPPPSAPLSAAPASSPTPPTAAALADVLDLSRGMSYKAALAGLDLGGGKAVIIGDPPGAGQGAEALLRAYGRFVQSLGGRYYTACDVGTFSPDMDDIARECAYVTGRTVAHGGAGDSSVLTAYGVFQGMRAAAAVPLGRADASRAAPSAWPGSARSATTSSTTCSRTARAVVVTDVSAAARRPRCATSTPSPRGGRHRRAGRQPLDVYAPCAMGGALTDEVVDVLTRHDRLRRRQQPARPPGHREGARGARDPLRARLLRELRRPDPGRRRARRASRFERAQQRATGIFDTTTPVFELAAHRRRPPAIAADRLAERRMRDVGRLRGHLAAAEPAAGWTSHLIPGTLRTRREPVDAHPADVLGGEGQSREGLGVVRPLLEHFGVDLAR